MEKPLLLSIQSLILNSKVAMKKAKLGTVNLVRYLQVSRSVALIHADTSCANFLKFIVCLDFKLMKSILCSG
jgi:hypothetical protein